MCAVVLALMSPQFVLSHNLPLTVTRIDGTEQNGNLVGWNANGLTLSHDEQTVAIASPELLRVQWRTAPVSLQGDATFIELVDGTRLPHQAYEVQAGRATITTPLSNQPLTISTERIRFVQLTVDAEPQIMLEQDLTDDLLVVRKKSGDSFDYLSGILGDVSSEQIDFRWDGEVIPVKLSKVAALAYFHADHPQAVEPICWLTLLSGARLPVTKISLTGGIAEVSTIAGLDLSIALESVRSADYSQGKLAYLSDLKPMSQKWTPRISLPASAELIHQHGLPRRDQSFSGSALTLFWPAADSRSPRSGAFHGELKNYSKGLALRSRTELRYRPPAGMQRFVTLAGIDPETADQGSVTLEIFAGQQLVWQGEIDGGSAPVEIDVGLGAARELRILVDYGENLDFGDRLHLVEARLSR